MSDPIRFLSNWSSMRGCRSLPSITASQIVRQDPFQFSAEIIARHELRVWFEPDWHLGRRLARRFPRCLICSIPVESDSIALRRVPGWRRRPDVGVV